MGTYYKLIVFLRHVPVDSFSIIYLEFWTNTARDTTVNHQFICFNENLTGPIQINSGLPGVWESFRDF